MWPYNFTPPLCLCCGVSLEQKVEIDQLTGLIYEVYYCPNCQEIYNKVPVSGLTSINRPNTKNSPRLNKDGDSHPA